LNETLDLNAIALGAIPYWCKEAQGGRKPINAKSETVRDLPTFRDAYRLRRKHRAGRWLLRVESDEGSKG
jgi:putative SOS response-associated peptidase YedK